MFFYFIADIKLVKMVSNRGRQVIPIAPFFPQKTLHRSSYTSTVFPGPRKRLKFFMFKFGCADFPVLGPDILQFVVNLEE